MRAILLLAWAIAGASLAVACGGDSSEPAAATTTPEASVATATPYAVEPSPTIVANVAPDTPAEVTYVVEPGDTLSGIAPRFDVTVEAIAARNDIADVTQIYVGQTLVIPTGPVEEDGDDATDEDPSTYVVQAGDTASEIALAFGATVEELAEANGVTVEEIANLHIGDRLTLPRPR
jgi:LysM repeat protein